MFKRLKGKTLQTIAANFVIARGLNSTPSACEALAIAMNSQDNLFYNVQTELNWSERVCYVFKSLRYQQVRTINSNVNPYSSVHIQYYLCNQTLLCNTWI